MSESPSNELLIFVFVHGFLGFSKLRLLFYDLHCFGKLEAELSRQGVPFVIPTLPPAGTVAERAEALAVQLAPHRSGSFVLIAYSMGGWTPVTSSTILTLSAGCAA